MLKKQLFSMFLAIIMAVTSVVFPAYLLAATENHKFTGDGFTISYILHSMWSNGYNSTIQITNNSSRPIENWTLISDCHLNVSEGGVFGARLIYQDVETAIAYMDWNRVIPAGETLTITLIGKHSGVVPVPTSYKLLSARDES
ncbi:MAG: cellulose-binding domain-containing protein, partial [Defluviitaleaceae bacterium]|nr:cellulose-binding domain-containing protein [Defluviitaleaceae bacterium]